MNTSIKHFLAGQIGRSLAKSSNPNKGFNRLFIASLAFLAGGNWKQYLRETK